jgi:large subunit ribosomal protein L13
MHHDPRSNGQESERNEDNRMIIDATDLLIGRFASEAAKKLLLGEEVTIVNCERAAISGNRQRVIMDYKQERGRGIPLQGPYYPKQSEMIVKRTIRGMLPHRFPRGREAFKRLRCYRGIPSALQGKKAETIEKANVKKLPTTKYVYIGEISKLIGAKQ